MIKIENVNKYYNKGKANQIHVINNTTMSLPDEGIVCLLGPSGCGKTTLLNAIGGLDTVDRGTISIDGQRITRHSSNKIDSIRNARIGYIFQNFNLLDDRTVFENVAIALRMIGIRDKTTVTARVRYCLEKVGIDQYRNKLAGSLSGGQRQRVAIARAIVKNPSIIIADEPTGNLDSANTLEIMNIIKTISRERLVILVTHERNIAEFYSDYVAEMKDGKIIKAYNNDSSRYLDYQLENKIYLKDMAVHKDFAKDDIRVGVYSDEERQADIKVVIRGNNLYINTGGRLNVVDETANIEMVDDHYTAMDESYFEDKDFDYTACLPSKYKAKYSSIYRLTNMISSGWKTVKGFKKIRKFLMLGFVFAAMFAFLAVSNVLGLIDVKPVDYRTTHANYLTIPNADRSEQLLDKVEKLDTVAFVLPGDTRKSITLPLDDYLQTNYAQEDINVSVALTNVLQQDKLIAGTMPSDPHEVIIDKAIIDNFLRNGSGNAVGLDTMEEFLGRRITVPNLDDYIIAGISDTESPTLFVDKSQAIYILSNGNDVVDEYSFDFEEDGEEDDVRSGRVMDLDLARNKIKVVKGEKPKDAFETIVNETHDEEMAIGKTINTAVAGRKLVVVGYYRSDSMDDDTYYVHSSTIKKYCIAKQKNFSAFASDTALVKQILDNEGLPAKINDTRDRKDYINSRKDQLTSSVVVAVIIMLISLIEMFLMLRSSFLSRIKEVGTLRAIGLKKKDIYRMFTGEILVITFITAVPGIVIMYFVLTQLVKVTYYIEGLYIITPAVAAITFGIILVFNLLAGLIPVFSTMRKTPAQILARTDI
ncbi:MAG: ATP-binding cassette domain-containing protein [Mogibacterium sp.]|nr:ATP-binding cassette domain-containing protein [Mogibacterium sp.]MBQ6501985.1 ATP-binding cassette domain-containing protein [Mogibacterium sp.]